jgi:TM2 domain-containing membrane protein YozV
MNCFQHPDAAVAAYCQNCGKPLCSQCVRSVNGVIYCESCLAAKLSGAGTIPQAIPPVPPIPETGPSPGLAAILGIIPGVGAMYNGQFIKALVHVLVFVVLIGITSHHGILGLFIPAWVIYQIFDAYNTAQARRDGLPLPDPFGLNELGVRLGFQSPAPPASAQPAAGSAPPPPPYPGQAYSGQPPYAPYPGTGYSEVPPVPGAPAPGAPYIPVGKPGREPVGAVVLIGLGVLFLLGTLGVFSSEWLWRSWPVLVVAVGVWLLVSRTRRVPPGGAQ